MGITVGQTTFDRVRYDAAADVVYLHVGEPSQAVDFDESPKGHALRFDRAGKLVGITIVDARRLLDRADPIVKREERLMRQAGIAGIRRSRGRGCTRRDPRAVPNDDLVGRRFDPLRPDRLWG